MDRYGPRIDELAKDRRECRYSHPVSGGPLVRVPRRRVFLASILLLAASIGAALAQGEKVYVTRTGAKYHRASCSSLRASKIEMPLAEAAARFGACAICRPPQPGAARSATPASPPSSAALSDADSSGPSASTPVLITRTGQRYHREGCRTLRNGGIPSTLGEASKGYTVCRVCKPSVLASSAVAPAIIYSRELPQPRP
jgi:hypothetical protein